MRTQSSVRVSLMQVRDCRLSLPAPKPRTRLTLDDATDWRVCIISLPAVAVVCWMLLFT